jgi:hypothetical protein
MNKRLIQPFSGSACCGKPLKVAGNPADPGSTCYYVCTACGKPAAMARSPVQPAGDDRTTREVTDGLEYISTSPPPEFGGFHPNTVRICAGALREIAQLRAQLDAKTRETEECDNARRLAVMLQEHLQSDLAALRSSKLQVETAALVDRTELCALRTAWNEREPRLLQAERDLEECRDQLQEARKDKELTPEQKALQLKSWATERPARTGD